jgi:hypothetical protein
MSWYLFEKELIERRPELDKLAAYWRQPKAPRRPFRFWLLAVLRIWIIGVGH